MRGRAGVLCRREVLGVGGATTLVCLDDSTRSFLSVKRRCAMCDVHVALDVVAGVAEAIHMARLMPLNKGRRMKIGCCVGGWRQKLEPLISGLPLSLLPACLCPRPERRGIEAV